MKRIFYGITHIILLVLMMSYMLISHDANGVLFTNALKAISFTGISIVGFIFIFPAITFSILSICIRITRIQFLRDMFSLFAGVFSLLTGILLLVLVIHIPLFIPIVLIIVSAVLFVLSSIGVIKAFYLETQKLN